jgi:DNA polymerase-1
MSTCGAGIDSRRNIILVNCDAKGLEIVAAAYLSQDKVMMQEIIDKFDLHGANQKRFGLPERVIAKVFVFRLIYGGSAYSYSVDPEFASVGFSQKKWQEVIDSFYEKYPELAAWHVKIVQDVTLTGKLVLPTGRQFDYEPFETPGGDLKWPRTTILNYPVQGLGADLVMLARISFWNRARKLGLKALLISTVHDSIVVDCPDDEVDIVCQLFHDVFRDIPENFKRMFGVGFNLPMTAEVLIGKTMGDMKEWKS